MRPALTILLLALLPLLAAVPLAAQAESEITEIHLGEAPPAPSRPDRALVKAVERFLAARQDGSIDRSLGKHARSLMAAKTDDEALFGPRDASIAAFDFHDDAIETLGAGRYRVAAYILFRNGAGQIVESRDETLVFAAREKGFVCTELKPTNVIVWNQQGVADAAATIGASLELERANRFLREGARGDDRLLAYSVAEVTRDPGGTVLVQCLRFSSRAGKRGFEVETAPLVLSRTADSIRVNTN